MNVTKALEPRIRGWFPQASFFENPPLFQGLNNFTSPKSAFWDTVLRFASGVFIFEILFFQLTQFPDLAWNFQINVFFIFVWMGLTVFWLRRKQGLNDWSISILFIISMALVTLMGALFWFTLINFTGYVTISAAILSAFTLLYAWIQKLRTDVSFKEFKNMHKFVSTSLVAAGVILLMLSLTLTSHIESIPTSTGHDELLLEQSFYLNQQIPNDTVSVNLTTQYSLNFFILAANVVPRSSSYSSMDFSISYQPPLGRPPVVVYQRNNITSYTRNPGGIWSVPQNGTYLLNFHYNYIEKARVQITVGKHWAMIESVPTKVYTPYLASYMTPTLIVASAFLIGGTAIPIQHVLKIKFFSNRTSGEFTNSPKS